MKEMLLTTMPVYVNVMPTVIVTHSSSNKVLILHAIITLLFVKD